MRMFGKLVGAGQAGFVFEKASNPKYFFAFPGQNHRDHPPDWFWEEVGKILNSRNESDANNNLQQ